MKKFGKKYNKVASLIEDGKKYSVSEACELVKKTATAKPAASPAPKPKKPARTKP